ncbi:transcriptional regulator, TetR family [Actinobacteria bacterium OK074]|nr:transcriptional regulator, TetR family [Actinobacteria bacterium OK074]
MTTSHPAPKAPEPTPPRPEPPEPSKTKTPRPERADATRNRTAVLRATERLLAAHGAQHISIDQVAAAAGVGKGTIFRRFGNRPGLFAALLEERAAAIREGIETGPPPLGPGAAALPRLHAFLDALADLATRNIALFAAHEQACAADRFTDPTYLRWHRHVSALLTAAHVPDPAPTAHILLGAFDADLVRLLRPEGTSAGPPDATSDTAPGTAPADAPDRLTRTVRNLATALVRNAPAEAEGTPHPTDE